LDINNEQPRVTEALKRGSDRTEFLYPFVTFYPLRIGVVSYDKKSFLNVFLDTYFNKILHNFLGDKTINIVVAIFNDAEKTATTLLPIPHY
jgi:hypothetical protein